MTAAKYHLGNLIAILDSNRVQLDGMVQDIMPVEPMADKWRASGWQVLEADGHSVPELAAALNQALATGDKPTIIIAHTTKGKGVSFMEDRAEWHGSAPNKEQVAAALEELK